MSQDAQDGDMQSQQPQGQNAGGAERPEPCQARCRFMRKDVLLAAVVLCVLLFLLVSFVNSVREAVNRAACQNNLKQIGLALHNYENANKAFPPGTICAMPLIQPGNQYDVLKEAAQIGIDFHGTSMLLRIIPFIEGDGHPIWARGRPGTGTIAKCWSPAANAGDANMQGPAVCDVIGFYCPSRRSSFRPQIDQKMMLNAPIPWTGGGTDYGGCAGRHAAFSLATGYNLCDASMHYTPEFVSKYLKGMDDTESRRWGIFGRVNVATTIKEIKDGTSNTIMTGELQRFTDVTPNSRDGWAIGGPCTLFTTGAMARRTGDHVEMVASPTEGKLMNNGFFGSPGSAHSAGANFGWADGSVRFLSEQMDPNVFALIGSMNDKVFTVLPD